MTLSIATPTRLLGLLLAPALLASAARADVAPGPPPVSPRVERAHYGAAFAAAEADKWRTAFQLASGGDQPLADKVLRWLWLTKAPASFDDIAGFVEANPDWPQQVTLRRRAEAAIDDRVDDDRVFAWFGAFPPLTGQGKARLATAFANIGDEATATALARDAWIEGDFSSLEEKRVLAAHGARLRPDDHAARLDRLLWDGKWRGATRMLRRVDADTRALGEARIKLMRRAGGVDAAIARVPELLRADAGLQYERLRWRRRKGFDDSAREILAALPDDLRRPDAWWTEASIGARRALHDGLASTAYRFTRDHRQVVPLPMSEAEWLAGWVALRFLGDAELSYSHFALLNATVSYPVSVARASYWAGRAAQAAGDDQFARHWYEQAAAYPTTYHGQLALAELGWSGPLPLPADPPIEQADIDRLGDHELMNVVRTLSRLGQGDQLRPFVLHLADLAATPGERRLVAQAAHDAGRHDLALMVARRGARYGTMLIEHGYPLIDVPEGGGVEPALLLAMARQESDFDAAAVSYAGARGLMQLMPATAKVVAARANLPYDRERLTADEAYNLALGAAYIADLLNDYGDSYVLALAAYNAGPRHVKRWIRDYGDPRASDVDVIDWIELIPYPETRDYIQRVLEAVPVYRRLLGQPVPMHTLRIDLNRAMPNQPS